MTTRLLSHTFSGGDCPVSASFSKVHGPNPGMGTIVFKNFRNTSSPDVVAPYWWLINSLLRATIGQQITVTCDNSEFIGHIMKKEIKVDDGSGLEKLHLTLSDWRDRLHDFYIFGAFNMFEENGKSWHLLPAAWKWQIKTYISKEFDQVDFDDLQDINTKSGQIEIVSKAKLLSSATILNIIAKGFSFQWTAIDSVKTILQKTRPININWQGGVTGAAALESVLSKSNMTWTIKGKNTVVVHQKGLSTSLFFDPFLRGTKSMCEIGGRQSSRGEEINDEGRNVLLIGERNKHQFIYPCRPDWNLESWDLRMCFDGWTLSALLKELKLFPWDKLGDMPKEYHDNRTWPGQVDGFAQGVMPTHRTRNEMKISEYVEKVCFRSYIVDFNYVVKELDFAISDINYDSKAKVYAINKDTLKIYKSTDLSPIGGSLKEATALYSYPFFLLNNPLYWFPSSDYNKLLDYSTPYPLSESTITDSNTQFIVLKTSRNIAKGKKYPFEDQKMFVPTIQGVSIETEEKIDPVRGNISYLVRLVFSAPQFLLDDLSEWRDPDKITPDKMCVILSLDKDIFTHERGSRAGVMVRTQKKSISNLYRAFVDEEEVIVLAQNFQRDLKKGGAIPAAVPVNAIKVANKISAQLLYHNAITRVGNISIHDKASHEPDGTIDTINVSWNDKSGLTEAISFHSSFAYSFDLGLPVSEYRVSRNILTGAKMNREILDAVAKSVIRHASKHGSAGETADQMFGNYGAGVTVGHLQRIMLGGIDDQHTVQADLDVSKQGTDGVNAGGVIMLKGK